MDTLTVLSESVYVYWRYHGQWYYDFHKLRFVDYPFNVKIFNARMTKCFKMDNVTYFLFTITGKEEIQMRGKPISKLPIEVKLKWTLA